ncbi:hypothetical protein [Novipirellula aureliae]|uniref:hypothetical protein n=1 Tax=Novipirellula aureliae TaxID=2527966 RepID=UPI0011B5E983|nr:hypothetical protein [Novipirellula aureliae]
MKSAIVLLSGRFGTTDESFTEAVHAISDHPVAVASYFGSLLCFAYASAFVCRYTAGPWRKAKASFFIKFHEWLPGVCVPHEGHTKRSVLHLSDSIDERDDHSDDPAGRRYGQWLRSCELPESETDVLGNHAVMLIVAAVIEMGGTPFLFKGILDKAYFGPDGELERLTMLFPQRRVIEATEIGGETEPASDGMTAAEQLETDGTYYPVRGDALILRMSEIKTLNFWYFVLMPPDNETPEESEVAHVT